MTSFLGSAQTDFSKDSLDIVRCKVIIRDLFEGKLKKDGVIQQDHVPADFFWCTICDHKIDCCKTFEDTYKKYLTKEIRGFMNNGDFERDITNEDDSTRRISMHWSWTKLDGESDEIYFEFVSDEIDNFRLVAVQKHTALRR